MNVTHFEVQRQNLRDCRLASEGLPEPGPGQALLKVDRFAFTANNITYAVFGEAMAYWSFFPAPAGWGRIPVWGFADVVRSRCDGLHEGERVFGYLPMSTHLLVQPDKLSGARFMDAMPHRLKLPAAYQSYTRTVGDPAHDAKLDDHQAIFRPLFVTSFLIEDFLSENNLFDAKLVVLSSASSKTALGLAHLLKTKRPNSCEVIGLTSASNVAFCARTGYYDRVIAYELLPKLPGDLPAVFVDMAGNGKLLHDVHHHFGDRLKYSCMVGGTHWDRRATQHNLPGAKPEFFFAPTQFQKRVKDWGFGGLESRLTQAMSAFLLTTRPWLALHHGQGQQAIETVYRDTLEGRVTPEQGHILSF